MGDQRIRILLVQPSAPYALRGFAPLALATIAGLTPTEFDVDVWDEVVLGPVDIDAAMALQYSIVGFSITFPYQAPRATELAQDFKERNVLTVIGGAFPSSNPTLFRQRADVLIVGESEELWPQFLHEWSEGRHTPEYRQIIPPDLSSAPPPKWGQLAEGFSRHYVRGSVQTTRGCPFDCEFCDVIYIYGRKQRHKAINTVLAEVHRQHELGMRTVFLADDAFEADPAYSTQLMEALIPANRKLEPSMAFEVQSGLNVARTDEFLRLVADSNFELLWMGIESPKPESLLSVNKTQNVRRDMQADLRRIAAHGIGVAAYMIVGLDEDDPDIFEQHVRFWTETAVVIPVVNILTAIPHTKLWLRLAAEGRLLAGPGSRDGIFNLASNIVPKHMSRKELLQGYRYLLERSTDWDFFALRLRQWLDSVHRVPEVRPPRAVDDLIARRRSALLGGDRSRRHFDDLVSDTNQIHPNLVPRVLTFLATHDARADYLQGYALPQLLELIRKPATAQRAPATKWTVPIPDAFRADFRRLILPRVFARMRANLVDESALGERLTNVFSDFLVRFGHDYEQFDESCMRQLLELTDRACAQANGVAPDTFIASEAAAADMTGQRLTQWADRLLKSISEDLIRIDPTLNRPERTPVWLG
jgi:radical SAM superfamily enzyme YgiQ (UPF0313 family)